MKSMTLDSEELGLLIQLGRRIAFLRKRNKMSQLDLSIEANVAKNYISDLENGRRNPSIIILGRIAMALRVNLAELLRGVGPMPSFLI